jgi:hypothetical protein
MHDIFTILLYHACYNIVISFLILCKGKIIFTQKDS